MPAIREDIDDCDVQYMYEVDGMTQQEIADYYGVSQHCIFDRLHPEKAKETADKYNQSEEGKDNKKMWWQSDNGIKYLQSDKRKEVKEISAKKYFITNKGRDVQKKWSKIMNSKRRDLGFIALNEPFENSHAHHIDEEHIIHIPKELHRSIPHNVWTGQGMEDINTIAFQYITEEMFDKLIAGEI